MEKDPRHYIEEIRANVAKMQGQKTVTATENALFGMVDGLAGIVMALMENTADLKRRVDTLEGR